MERRTFIGGGAAAIAAVATAACKGGSADADTTGSSSSSGTSIRSAAAAPANWTTAHQLYNTRFDGLKPAAVAYVAHADDIRTTLAYAHAHGIKVAIRNGGHSYAGWSSGNGKLILDVSKLKQIRVSGGQAVVGAGSKLIDVYRALTAKGVTIPAGSCPTVGVSGLVLGGGHGVVSRAYGLTCDSLTQATLITADGKQLTANASENKDLFWALRGAGNGNFGVVTELHFKTHPAPQAVSAYVTWPWSKAAAVVKAWQEWGPDQPDEIWSSCHLENGGSPTVSVAAFSIGTYGDLQNAIDRLVSKVGSPARSATLKRHTYEGAMEAYAGCSSFATDAQCHLPGSTLAATRRAPWAGRPTRPARTSSTARSPRPASRPCSPASARFRAARAASR